MKLIGEGSDTRAKRTTCRYCDKPLPEDSDPRRKYCDAKCRVKFNKELQREADAMDVATKMERTERAMMMREASLMNTNDEMVVEFRSRAFDKIEDEIRDVMRDEIRKQVGQLIRDKAMGAATLLVDMLPNAMARIKQDLDSKDTIARRAATALVMKYAMPMMQAEEKTTAGLNVIVHSVPRPDHSTVIEAEYEVDVDDAPAGESFEDRVDRAIEAVVEDFEKDWPVCARCKTPTHPDNTRKSPQGSGLLFCKSCAIRTEIESGKAPVALDNSPYYG